MAASIGASLSNRTGGDSQRTGPPQQRTAGLDSGCHTLWENLMGKENCGEVSNHLHHLAPVPVVLSKDSLIVLTPIAAIGWNGWGKGAQGT